jgi:O-methyltransferase involved in polyketide biosynthesis
MNQQGKVDFSAVRWGSVEGTNLSTLYLSAYESCLERPILGDRAAAAATESDRLALSSLTSGPPTSCNAIRMLLSCTWVTASIAARS